MDVKKPEYSLRRVGRPFTKDYRIYFERNADGIAVSPFHDIPLYHDKDQNVFNMVVEVPRWTNAKFEISRSKSLNPITQDILDSNPRFVKSCFPYKGYIWNYGALPQTWEDPHYTNPETGAKGDNDPIDACEIGRAIARTGDVKQVKILGILGLLDEGETDWKLMVIDVTDPLSDKLHDIGDVEKHLPGLLDATRDWFRIYMVPDGFPPNEYALEGKFIDKGYALNVVKECNEAWDKLVNGEIKKGDISLLPVDQCIANCLAPASQSRNFAQLPQMEDFEERGPRRAHGGPYTSKHPVPTIRGYREHRAEIKQRQDQAAVTEFEGLPLQDSNANDNTINPSAGGIEPGNDETDLKSKGKRAYESIKTIAKDEDQHHEQQTPYQSVNRHTLPPSEQQEQDQQAHTDEGSTLDTATDGDDEQENDPEEKSPTETAAATISPKEKRKAMKKANKGKKRKRKGRKVTDPVTHLPVVIHDMTDGDLKAVGSDSGVSGLSSSDEEGGDEDLMQWLFPPPDLRETKKELGRVYEKVMSVYGIAVGVILGLVVLGLGWGKGVEQRQNWTKPSLTRAAIVLAITVAATFGFSRGLSFYISKKVDQILEDQVWDADREQELSFNNRSSDNLPESVAWLNSLLGSIWPLINPDLFASLVDTLEDVMQASLPKVIRMVSVDDIGQGTESVRILGIKSLPTGKAGESVSHDDGDGPEEMEAEEGDFVNLELAFAYRAQKSGKTIKSKAKNAHLYLKFYLPGGLAVPVWVELKGLVGVMRFRLQLTPDPPFFELCTLTFLGQPRADISCVPLSKHSLNVMNVPLISGFVQSALDATLAEYVAPKSLTLNLKDMLVGDDFKKDTVSRGVVAVHIDRARGFKEGDSGLGVFKAGSSDSYVSVSWGKFGKPVGCTRIIKSDQAPNWNEWIFVLVTPDEINAEETLRIQLWDSDKLTADDELGRVEVNLKELMHGHDTRNKMCQREDHLRADDPDEKIPGQLWWSVGYFSKAHIQQCQLDRQTFDPSIRTIEDLKKKTSEHTRYKLRETLDTDSEQEKEELSQQEVQDLKQAEDMMIISAPPPEGLPSGILSIQIHNITGLEVEKLNRDRSADSNPGGNHIEAEGGAGDGDAPDGYCTIILNHTQVYRTRTKPKNAHPFFNAGTERFVRDWKSAEVIIAVRDSREGENDPLLGVVYLPLRKVFAERSQVMETRPLAGGIGYGRVRVSMVWRSVELNMVKEIGTGWEFGTLEVKAPIKAAAGLDEGLKKRWNKVKLQTKVGKEKMHFSSDIGGWRPKRQNKDSVFLGVSNRYATSMVIEFRDTTKIMGEDPVALAALWLGDIPDEEETNVRLKVWRGGKKQLKRARGCADFKGSEDGEKPLGEVEMTVRFWRGLSRFHKHLGGKSGNKATGIKSVLEVLDAVNDENMMDFYDGSDSESKSSSGTDSESTSDSDSDSWAGRGQGALQTRDSHEEAEKRKMIRKAGHDSSTEYSSDEDEAPSNGNPIMPIKKAKTKIKKRVSSLLDGKGGSDDDGKRGPISQLQDYKRHRKQLHRKHRGVMQWKAARSVDWMVDKVKDGKHKVQGLMDHSEKEQGIETEVCCPLFTLKPPTAREVIHHEVIFNQGGTKGILYHACGTYIMPRSITTHDASSIVAQFGSPPRHYHSGGSRPHNSPVRGTPCNKGLSKRSQDTDLLGIGSQIDTDPDIRRVTLHLMDLYRCVIKASCQLGPGVKISGSYLSSVSSAERDLLDQMMRNRD
ncbi:hypothetical protein B0T21DRAFT_393179 [Apiosordaria backusii]|uniref:Inorganic pyrophosphatase n=1 Tax=Apiosordaria backusii TaxID=314023 RepID=A0AA40EG90_9PEZI|nr:hypothetical protein B0T21DRAFT_393179 [Apiosordaria backusii]